MTVSDMVLLRIALTFVPQLRQRYADYVEECESYRRDGYRPHHCEHGTNLWTDYDNICGPCEDGYTLRKGVHLYGAALDWARQTVDEAWVRYWALEWDSVLDSGDDGRVRAFLAAHKPDMKAIWECQSHFRYERESV